MTAPPLTRSLKGHEHREAQPFPALQPPRDRGHTTAEPQRADAAVAPSPTLSGPLAHEAQNQSAGQGGDSSPTSSIHDSAPKLAASWSGDALLLIMADTLDDMERTRIACENRVRSLVQVKGLQGTLEAATMQTMVDDLRALEHQAELELKRALRKHPLGPWVRAQKGLGEKQAGRLLAAIGDPYIRPELVHKDGRPPEPARPRTVSELWAYTGYHVLHRGQTGPDAHARPAAVDLLGGGDAGHPSVDAQARIAGIAPSRARGQKANWSAAGKMRAYLVAESCAKQLRKPCAKPEGQSWAEHAEDCACSPYRVIYDQGREKYAEAIHGGPCKRCGPAGKPAAEGSDLSEGHKHARALRLVAKAILRDLWCAARDLHAEGAAQ